MPEFKHILFPVDFSDRCRAAEPFVISMARQFQARLTLLHVIAFQPDGTEAWRPHIRLRLTFPQCWRQVRNNSLLTSQNSAISQADRIVKHGDAADEITAFAREQNIDLIMMPTHGYGKFRSLLLGSITAKALHDADCPVWTAAHTEDPDIAEHAERRSILCAIDLVPEGAGLIRYATDLAKTYQAELRLVHAAPAPEIRSADPHDAEFRRHLLQWTRERIAVLQRQAGTDLEVCLDGGSRPASCAGRHCITVPILL